MSAGSFGPVKARSTWPPEFGGVIAAPEHHKVLFENSEVRVIETVVRSGDTTPIHALPKTVMYVISGDQFVRRDDAGNVVVDTRAQGESFVMPQVVWSDGTPPHVIENPGHEDLVVVGIELKP